MHNRDPGAPIGSRTRERLLHLAKLPFGKRMRSEFGNKAIGSALETE